MSDSKKRKADAKERQNEVRIAAEAAAEASRVAAQAAADEKINRCVSDTHERLLDKLAQLPQPMQEGFLQFLPASPGLQTNTQGEESPDE